jgi:hypothetical protein
MVEKIENSIVFIISETTGSDYLLRRSINIRKVLPLHPVSYVTTNSNGECCLLRYRTGRTLKDILWVFNTKSPLLQYLYMGILNQKEMHVKKLPFILIFRFLNYGISTAIWPPILIFFQLRF